MRWLMFLARRCYPRWCQLPSLSALLPLHPYTLSSRTCVIFCSCHAKESVLPLSNVGFFVVHAASGPPSLYRLPSLSLAAVVFLPHPPPPQNSVATYLYYHAMKNMPVCLCADISILWRLPVGTWDKLISWLSSCPGSSLLLSLYLFQRLCLTSILHLTRWDEYTCFMVVQKKKAIWGSGLITFLSVREVIKQKPILWIMFISVVFLRTIIQCISDWPTLFWPLHSEFVHISDFNSNYFPVLLYFCSSTILRQTRS